MGGYTPDGYRSLNIQGLDALLVKAVKEQQGVIEKQRATIQQQQEMLEQLMERVGRLETESKQ